MKQIWKIAGMALIACLGMGKAEAQKGELKMNLNYNYGIPLGDLKNNFIDKGSARGFNADLLYWFKPQWGVGLGVGFQDYYQKYGRDVYKLGDGSDISAVMTNSMQIVPVMAKAMYSPMAGKTVQPYVTMGAGAAFINNAQYLGEFGGTESNGKFIAQAGTGVKLSFGKQKQCGFLLGAAYNFSPYNKYDIKNLNTINLQAGFQFRLK